MTTRATVRVERQLSRWRDRLRKYVVLIDGQPIGEVANGETRDFDVEPGVHDVRLKIDWCGSPEVRCEFPPGGMVKVLCRVGGSSWAAVIHTIFDRNNYIQLDLVYDA